MIAPEHRDRAHVNSKLKLLTEAGHFQVQFSARFGFARWLPITAEDDQRNPRHKHGQFESEAARWELWLL